MSRTSVGESGLSTLVDGVGAAATPDAGALQRGLTISRYVIVDRVGAGGMGEVYAAYDPDLDRKLALKVLRATDDNRQRDAQTRMLREAQALASLAHPNVVTIHDVGVWEGRVWLAMEFVAGTTLTRWMASPRSWREVLEVLIPAGIGVAAAHASGLLHRDLKPDNIMLGDDGRVRVMDFGLARASRDPSIAESQAGSTSGESALRSGESVLADDVTRAGALIGTPAYMAPEQFQAGTIGAAADQFSLCVTIWEALYGQRPFTGATLAELAGSIFEGTPRLGNAAVPGWLRRIVARGLALDPSQRWPGIGALLDALERGRKRARRRRPILVVTGLAVVVGIGVAVRAAQHRAEIAACDETADEIAAQWPGRRAEVDAAILGGGAPFAPETVQRLGPWLDEYVEAWRDVRRGWCMASVEGPAAQSLIAQGRACLEVDRLRLAAILDALASEPDTSAISAVTTAASLPPPRQCADEDALARTPAPQPEQLARVVEIEGELGRAAVRQIVGDYDGAAMIAEHALEAATALEWAPLVARAGIRLGHARMLLGRLVESEDALHAAYFEAARADAWSDAASAATLLVQLVGGKLAHFREARTWADHAAAMLARAGGNDSLRASELDRVLSTVENTAGELAQARRLAERSLENLESELGAEHPMVADALHTLGMVCHSLDDLRCAAASYSRAVEIRERTFGPHHPRVANALASLANVARELGELERATALLRRAISIEEASLGSTHLDLVVPLSALAAVYIDQSRFVEAEALGRRVLAIEILGFGTEHHEVAATMINLGGALRGQGKIDEAAVMLEAAAATTKRTIGEEHPQYAIALLALGNLRMAQRRGADAESTYRAGAEVLRRAGVTGDSLAAAWLRIAWAQAEQGHDAEAETSIGRSLELFADGSPAHREHFDGVFLRGTLEAKRGRPRDAVATFRSLLTVPDSVPGSSSRAQVRFELATSLWQLGEREDAVREAKAASDLLTATPESRDGLREEVDAWLRANTPR